MEFASALSRHPVTSQALGEALGLGAGAGRASGPTWWWSRSPVPTPGPSRTSSPPSTPCSTRSASSAAPPSRWSATGRRGRGAARPSACGPGRVGPLVPVELSATRLADDEWRFDGLPDRRRLHPLGAAGAGRPLHVPDGRVRRPPGRARTRACPSSGGFASGASGSGRHPPGPRATGCSPTGAVGVLLGPATEVVPVVSQGCRPFGRLLTVTGVERNLVREIAGRPAMECMVDEIAEHLGRADIAGIEGNGLLLGRCVDTRVARPRPGRPPLPPAGRGGAGHRGRWPSRAGCPLGSVVQFAVRDARTRRRPTWPPRLAGHDADAALLFTCNGRGTRLFDVADHDAAAVGRALGPVPLGGHVRRRRVRAGRRRQLRAQLRRVPRPVPVAWTRATRRPPARCPTGRVWPDAHSPPATTGPGPVRRARAAGRRRHPRPGHRRAPGRRLRATRARPWRSPPWPTCCSPAILRHDPSDPRLARPRPVRPVQRPRLDPALLDAPPDRVRTDPRRPRAFRQLGQRHPGPSRAAPHRRRGGHHRPARPGVRQRRRHGHRRAVAAGPLLARGVRPPHLRRRRRRLPGGGHLPRGGLAGRPPAASAAWSTSTTTTTSPSTGPPSWRSTTTPPSGSPPTAGPSTTSATSANDLDALEAALLRARADEDRPSLIILRSHIGYPAPGPDRHRPRPTATRSATRRRRRPRRSSACPADQTFWVPDDVLAMYRVDHPPGPGHAGRVGGAPGRLGRRPGPVRRRPRRATACPGGSRRCPPSPRPTGPWPPARPSRRAWTPPTTACPA